MGDFSEAVLKSLIGCQTITITHKQGRERPSRWLIHFSILFICWNLLSKYRSMGYFCGCCCCSVSCPYAHARLYSMVEIKFSCIHLHIIYNTINIECRQHTHIRYYFFSYFIFRFLFFIRFVFFGLVWKMQNFMMQSIHRKQHTTSKHNYLKVSFRLFEITTKI